LKIASTMAEKRSKVVVLGTGGTISGWAPDPSQGRQNQAGELTASELVLGLGLGFEHIVTEEVARIDSKNMGWPVWLKLLTRLQRKQVC
jgi:L-asparaginase